jgi:hypothetical protein
MARRLSRLVTLHRARPPRPRREGAILREKPAQIARRVDTGGNNRAPPRVTTRLGTTAVMCLALYTNQRA